MLKNGVLGRSEGGSEPISPFLICIWFLLIVDCINISAIQFSVFRRRVMHGFFEYAVEIGNALKTRQIGDICYWYRFFA